MIIHNPTNLEELLEIKAAIRLDSWSPYLAFFRGQIFDWEIKPNITRNPKLSKEKILKIEKAFFGNYIEEKVGVKVLEHFDKDNYKHAQDWHNLFQAQHLGFYTRLTDWTQQFEHALFFSTDDENECYTDKEGIVWIYKCPKHEEFLINFNRDEDDVFFDIHPFELDKFYMVKHPSLFPGDFMEFAGEIRRFRQDGSFMISTSAEINTPIEEIDYIVPHLEKIIINPELKKEIEGYLNPSLREYFYFSSEENNDETLLSIRDLTSKSNNDLFWNNI